MKDQLQVLVIALTVISTAVLEAQDWPQWRGPDRDAVASAFNVGLMNSKSNGQSKSASDMPPLYSSATDSTCLADRTKMK